MPRVDRERRNTGKELPQSGKEFYWYLVLDHSTDELLAIMRSKTSTYVPLEDDAINTELGDMGWYLVQTTQTEFETYQAFGIKEIKL